MQRKRAVDAGTVSLRGPHLRRRASVREAPTPRVGPSWQLSAAPVLARTPALPSFSAGDRVRHRSSGAGVDEVTSEHVHVTFERGGRKTSMPELLEAVGPHVAAGALS